MPHWAHFGLALLSGGMSFLNNLVFAFNVSQPTHIVFRTSGLLISCIVGAAFFGRSYSMLQIIAVVGMAVGSSLCTLAEAAFGDTATEASAMAVASNSMACCSDQLSASWLSVQAGNWTGAAHQGKLMAQALLQNEYASTWAAGIGLLMITVTIASFLGQLQKVVADTFGRAPTESIFYSHIVPLVVAWVGMGPQLLEQLKTWGGSPPAASALSSLTVHGHTVDLTAMWAFLPAPVGDVPVMFFALAINVLSQWMCIQGVYNLTAYADPLTSNVVMTVRKFVSLLFSVVLFGNTFTQYHWVAAVLVFACVTLYSWAPGTAPARKTKVE